MVYPVQVTASEAVVLCLSFGKRASSCRTSVTNAFPGILNSTLYFMSELRSFQNPATKLCLMILNWGWTSQKCALTFTTCSVFQMSPSFRWLGNRNTVSSPTFLLPAIPASNKISTTGTMYPSTLRASDSTGDGTHGPGALSGRQSKCTGRCPQVASDQVFVIPKPPI